jgi:hypothetical protein
MVSFSGAARPLSARDVEEVAGELGCEVAALRAVLDVESKNRGFDAKGRPTILFEPHVFYRNLHGDEQRKAISQGLAYPAWKKNYPKGKTLEIRQDKNYERLALAARINQEAAFRSISVGRGQVLGENYRIVGYDSAVAMFEAALESERVHLEQMAAFIRSKRIDDDLRNRTWATFARVYNGPGQVDFYAGELAKAYAKWRKIVSKPREELTAADLKAAGSQTIAATESAKGGLLKAGVGLIGAGGLSETVQSVTAPIEEAAEHVRTAHGALAWLQDNWRVVGVVLLALLAAYGVWSIWRGIQAAEAERVRNAREGVNERI